MKLTSFAVVIVVLPLAAWAVPATNAGLNVRQDGTEGSVSGWFTCGATITKKLNQPPSIVVASSVTPAMKAWYANLREPGQMRLESALRKERTRAFEGSFGFDHLVCWGSDL